MTAKRFRLLDETIIDNKKVADDGGKQTYWIVEYGQRVKVVELLNGLHEENIQLREHFIYLIATALEDKECRKIYAKGLLEIFDDCSNLDEAKSKIKEYLE